MGALPVAHDRVAHLIADGDTRWINRGAYDLMDVNATATSSAAGLPKATALYGPLPAQLEQPNSFVNQLKALLKVRQAYRIYAARQIDVPDVQSPGLLVMVHELPDGMGTQITALNFGATPVDEVVRLAISAGVHAGPALNMFSQQIEGAVTADGDFRVRLAGHSGASYLISP